MSDFLSFLNANCSADSVYEAQEFRMKNKISQVNEIKDSLENE